MSSITDCWTCDVHNFACHVRGCGPHYFLPAPSARVEGQVYPGRSRALGRICEALRSIKEEVCGVFCSCGAEMGLFQRMLRR